MENWLTAWKIPLGAVAEAFFDWLIDNLGWFFDGFAALFEFLIDGLTDILLFPPPLVLVALIAALTYWLQRSRWLTVGVALSLLLVINLGYWADTIQTLSLIVFATAFCMVIGVPLGIAAAHRKWLWTGLRPVLDLMQTLPTFVYLIPTLILFGLGVVPGLVSTVIFAIPAPIRLTYLGVSSAPKHLVEAAEAFGATKSQLLWKVELPHALPTIMAGLTQAIMLSLSMVVIAALVGAPGLGKPVVRALTQVNVEMGFEAGLAIVILAIILDRVCNAQRRKSPGGPVKPAEK
ncbi:MAG: choline ABC transporter permease subunit [Rhodovibrionaceae bacterium]